METTNNIATTLLSSEVNELFSSLCQFQGELAPIKKDSKAHRHFYADINTVLKVVRPLLHKHGLSIQQHPTCGPDGSPALNTILGHKSGQYISSTMPISIPVEDVQQYGGFITYLRRYALVSILGIEQEDNDGYDLVGAKKNNESSLATEKQLAYLQQVLAKMPAGTEDKLLKYYKVNSIKKLSKNAVSAFFDSIK